MTATAASVSLRWSSVRSCPRKAVYEATNAPARDRSEREHRILWRGRSLGREYVAFLRNKYGTDNVLAEVPVAWPLGTGHMDAYLVPTKAAIEVLSSAHASADMVRSKMLQLVGYMEHTDLAIDAGALVVLDPGDFTDEIFPLAKTSKLYGELVEEMRDRIAQVQTWAGQGTLPARVCLKPSDAIGRFCLHAEHCFAGWEKPALPTVDNEEARQLVTSLYRAKQAERDIRLTLATAETARKEIEQTLVDLIPVGKHVVGPLEISRTHVERKPSFQWEKAETAGVFEPGLYDGYFKPGSSYDTFRVERVSDMPLPPQNFGDEAPF